MARSFQALEYSIVSEQDRDVLIGNLFVSNPEPPNTSVVRAQSSGRAVATFVGAGKGVNVKKGKGRIDGIAVAQGRSASVRAGVGDAFGQARVRFDSNTIAAAAFFESIVNVSVYGFSSYTVSSVATSSGVAEALAEDASFVDYGIATFASFGESSVGAGGAYFTGSAAISVGSADATAIGAGVVSVVAASAGAATATAQAGSTFVAAGDALAFAFGYAITPAVAEASGSAVADGAASDVGNAIGSSVGSASCSAVGRWIVPAKAEAFGIGAADGIVFAESAGFSYGFSTADARGYAALATLDGREYGDKIIARRMNVKSLIAKSSKRRVKCSRVNSFVAANSRSLSLSGGSLKTRILA